MNEPTPTTQPATATAPAAPSPFEKLPEPTQGTQSAGPAAIVGDTSFIDGIASREPLVKQTTVPGIVVACTAKESETTGKPFLNVSVALYGDKMVYDDGTPVSQGKRLANTFFASAKDREKGQRTARTLKNLLLALNDVPLSPEADKAYLSWPIERKVTAANTPTGELVFGLHAFQPPEKWVGTKVLVEVRIGKDMDGNPRNEFVLLAASTPRKSK